MAIEFEVNGRPVSVSADDATPLLWVLREHLGLTGTKYGCGVAACGACTVHVNGEAARSCQVPVSMIAGASVTTIEGLSPNGQHPLQRAWGRPARPQSLSDPGRDHPGHGRQPVPLRHLYPDRARDRARC